MEEYGDIENDAPDGFDASAAAGHEHDAAHKNLQVAHQLEVEAERSQLASARTLKATRGNAAKRLKMRQETSAVTRASKTAEATVTNASGNPG